ncbi:uncharacterized protein LOC110497430 isoform X1 [Oncorhynchus mykiss]|uniref:uncharacterized protein LOC110497430 isoform X1 n=1 Tax=Oncorhynchus mykiss TaxID=8022 RepID=UPI0018776380|nr:uncharacterized protein LOC110497430 isoform X1 [Oncorhynchus mykiss]
MMSSTESGTDVPKLHRLFIMFDPEVVAVMSILLGLFQVLLAVPLYYIDIGLPKLQLTLPLFIGFLMKVVPSGIWKCLPRMNQTCGGLHFFVRSWLISFYFPTMSSKEALSLKFVMAGSFAFACEKSPSRQLLTGCAYTNVASLVASLLALCSYSVSLHSVQGSAAPCTLPSIDLYTWAAQKCPGEYLEEFFRSIIVLLIVYDLGALTLHSLLSFSALKGLGVRLCRMIN